jgi:hypothetical protein
LVLAAFVGQAQEYKVITTIESIVGMGMGRSRIIETKEVKNIDNTEHHSASGKEGKMAKRGEIKVESYDESKLLNFYSGVGINFQNIASNDALITAKINKLTKEGWTLVFVSSAVESDAGKQDGKGLFITRYIFKK